MREHARVLGAFLTRTFPFHCPRTGQDATGEVSPRDQFAMRSPASVVECGDAFLAQWSPLLAQAWFALAWRSPIRAIPTTILVPADEARATVARRQY